MLDIQTGITIKDAITDYAAKRNKWFHVSLEDVCRMQMIPASATGEKDNYTILTLQKEHTTILANVRFTSDSGVIVREIYMKNWDEEN